MPEFHVRIRGIEALERKLSPTGFDHDLGQALLTGAVIVQSAAQRTVHSPDHPFIGKAGRNRWMGWRPSVRGTAMNPIDHPHGGGEGRTKGGRHPVTPWGKPTKGAKTRHNKQTDKLIIRRRNAK